MKGAEHFGNASQAQSEYSGRSGDTYRMALKTLTKDETAKVDHYAAVSTYGMPYSARGNSV